MKYVVDIDDTICKPGAGNDDRYTGATPKLDRITQINKLYDEGNIIIYFTARGMGRHKNNADLAKRDFYKFTQLQLSSWGCKYHELHLGKPNADLYIDDKGIHCNDFFTMTSSEIINKPWGNYEVLLDQPNYKVKRIVVDPYQRFSLQYHNHREEHWVVVHGSGIVQVKQKEYPAFLRSHWVILPKDIHRATSGPDGLVFIETQIGDCREDDIVRIEDDFGRTS